MSPHRNVVVKYLDGRMDFSSPLLADGERTAKVPIPQGMTQVAAQARKHPRAQASFERQAQANYTNADVFVDGWTEGPRGVDRVELVDDGLVLHFSESVVVIG